ncbi:hypothetical protein DESC_780254 [Desulfosarcina cetonica]|nr:hypothetical protein DESC_780254 [Desulfosarcina cetonica]
MTYGTRSSRRARWWRCAFLWSGGSYLGFLSHHLKIGEKLRSFGHFRDGLSLLGQGAGGAYLDAFPAAGAGFGLAPGLVEIRYDSGMNAPAGNVPGAGALDVLADTDAPQAQNTPVMVQRKSGMGGIHRLGRVEIVVADMGHAELDGQILQLTVAVDHADRADMVSFREDQLQYFAAVVADARRVGDHVHILLHQGDAGGKQLRAPLDFHDAQAAGAPFGKAVQMAQGGNENAVLAGYRQDGLVFPAADVPAVDPQGIDAYGIDVRSGLLGDRCGGCHVVASRAFPMAHTPASQ